jgi:nucleotide-binding universal stress UspA family protein
MLEKILVAFDGSEQSSRAFDNALELTKLCSAAMPEVTVIAVTISSEPIDGEVEAMIDSAVQYYDILFRRLEKKANNLQINIKTKMIVGDPADQIVRYANDNNIDMIFMGHTGKSKIESLLLGSVSKRVVTYSHCPVTIVK